jgi:hypothetical protein
MKKCPTCEKTFDDSLRFCQMDGTPLVAMAETSTNDPYKTTVGRQDEFTSATPLDPMKTMVGGSLKKEESGDLLQLPQEQQDPLKTMFISDEEMNKEMSAGVSKKEAVIKIPPVSGDLSSSVDKSDSPYDSPPPPKFDEPSLNPPSFGDMSSSPQSGFSSPTDYSTENTSNPFSDSSFQSIPSPFDQKTAVSDSKSPFDNSPFNQPGTPIPSPFSDAKPTSYELPSTPLPTYKEPEPASYEQNNPFSQSPFGQSAPVNQPLQQTEWTPPPAPNASWQNQEIGANTPFQPPASDVGQNQTLAIISLVSGILSLLCCAWFLPGIAAVVLGFMAKSKAEQNPNEYGGRGLALGGIITGGISVVLGIIVMILYLFTGLLAGIGNL